MGRLVGSLDLLFGRGRAEGGYGDESLQSLHAEGESKLSGAGEKGAELFVLCYLLNSGFCKEHGGTLKTKERNP